jgi:hypothetical protein
MSKQQFSDKKIRGTGLAMIERINAIGAEYQEAGYRLTLRQMFYQVVARGILENTGKSYDYIGRLLNDARLCGLVDWGLIEDRTRRLAGTRHYRETINIRQAVESEIKYLKLDPWTGQPCHVEAWVEKDALISVVANACDKYNSPYLSTRGFSSVTLLKDAADRMIEKIDAGKHCVILHLSDHDPAGLEMTEDLRERLAILGAGAVEVRRIGLTREQIEQYSPPPNFAKIETDTRAARYVREHGPHCWELDALPPDALIDLIGSNIEALVDPDVWGATLKTQEQTKAEAWRKYRPLLEQIA